MGRTCVRLIFCLISLHCITVASSAQNTAPPAHTPPDDDLKTDTDPTRPILFSIRPEFYSFGPDVYQESLILRYDTATFRQRRLFAARTGLLLRLEAPVVMSHTRAGTHAGLGDAYAQFLSAAYLSRKFAFFWGSGIVIPTATHATLGRGKWILAPAVAPLWFIPHRGMFFVKLQDFISVTGDKQRSDVNHLLVTPTFIYRVNPHWWIIAETETKTNWKLTGRTGFKGGFQVGHVFTSKFGAWIKPEVWWGPNRDGRWNVKLGFVWYRER